MIFVDGDERIWLFNTAQPAGGQDEAQVFLRPLHPDGAGLAAGEARDTGLPPGTFIRGPVRIRDDGAWMLPLFLRNPRPGQRGTGAHDSAAMAISRDGGRSWTAPVPTDVPNKNSSIAAVRLADGRIALVCNPVSAEMSQARRASLYDELGDEDARPEASGGCRPVWGVPRAPLTLFLSTDGGRTFPTRHVIADGPGTCLSNNSLDGRNRELSYPALLTREDVGLDIAFTLHRRAIQHVRFRPDLLATLTEGESR